MNSCSYLLRLTYVGSATHEPILSRIAAQTKAEITILQGVIARIKNTPYGQLIVELLGEENDIDTVLKLLGQADIRVDVLNHLLTNALVNPSTHAKEN